MPVTRERERSPQDRRSASPPGPHHVSFAGPSKPRMTTNDVQKRRLEKLFANPEKDAIPVLGPVEPKMRPVQDIIKNVQASSAAAGSGEFHVYKHSRRREFERIKQMERTTRDLEEQAAFKARQEARDAEADAKTAKNRAKRQKRRGGNKGEAEPSKETSGGGLKRKLESNSTITFKRPGESDEESEGEATADVPAPSVLAPMVEQPMKIEEREITIHDDD